MHFGGMASIDKGMGENSPEKDAGKHNDPETLPVSDLPEAEKAGHKPVPEELDSVPEYQRKNDHSDNAPDHYMAITVPVVVVAAV
jgi:hypothetical protein